VEMREMEICLITEEKPINENVKQEINNMEPISIIYPIKRLEWASPVVV